jgi:hypothetical protein
MGRLARALCEALALQLVVEPCFVCCECLGGGTHIKLKDKLSARDQEGDCNSL